MSIFDACDITTSNDWAWLSSQARLIIAAFQQTKGNPAENWSNQWEYMRQSRKNKERSRRMEIECILLTLNCVNGWLIAYIREEWATAPLIVIGGWSSHSPAPLHCYRSSFYCFRFLRGWLLNAITCSKYKEGDARKLCVCEEDRPET